MARRIASWGVLNLPSLCISSTASLAAGDNRIVRREAESSAIAGSQQVKLMVHGVLTQAPAEHRQRHQVVPAAYPPENALSTRTVHSSWLNFLKRGPATMSLQWLRH